jgi:AP-1 complex subunit mu
VLRSEILGAVKMRSSLSGMPELKLGLNDKVFFEMNNKQTRSKLIDLEDIKFH